MRAALHLARRGVGRTAPNPPVGAVVVKEGAVIGRGYHRAAGLPHAEVEALAEAGDAATGADLYVTLEPCAHHGRTPPCTEAIIRAGIRRVIYAVADPDPKVAGRGDAQLQEAGVAVERGLLAAEAEDLYEAYYKHRLTGTPLGVLKLACTLDGKVATAAGESRWITGESARKHVHRLRNESDAVLVGVGTVLADDPQLTTRLRGGRDALRVIADSRGRTPPTARAVAGKSRAGCLIAMTNAAPPENLAALRAAGAEVVTLPAREGRVDLAALWRMLGERGLLSVLIEGGPELAAGAMEAGVVDKLLLFVAPSIIGGNEAPPVLGGRSVERLADARRLDIRRVRRFGPDLLIEACPCSRD
ncbi:MAG: bifunctional diaminohydroxyphosphoribosylaminopyrimidine deaminase/5-amino-6-(5-phosphoribosylamino)uracil reductase RibD [Armatimonadetes bacterium]|nr:bifunctional diaminohydroxyphosphoribosylaminopyrimidine deaminase/5-amino-6-(5-phosphoribosylamino)uracil reductase RibD [Armatimonadota bacterium]